MSAKGRRLLRVFKALKAHPLIGLSNKEIAADLAISPVQVCRDLQDLQAEGLIQKLENGNYAYGIYTLQIAERFRYDQERLKLKLNELEQRINISMY